MQERWRTWGTHEEYAEQGASARRRSLVANGYESPTVRQWQNYDRRGFSVVAEPGSDGWPGHLFLSKPSGVTHVVSLHVGLVAFRESFQDKANLTRGEKMRTAKAARKGQEDPTALCITDPSSGSMMQRLEWIGGGSVQGNDMDVPPPFDVRP